MGAMSTRSSTRWRRVSGARRARAGADQRWTMSTTATARLASPPAGRATPHTSPSSLPRSFWCSDLQPVPGTAMLIATYELNGTDPPLAQVEYGGGIRPGDPCLSFDHPVASLATVLGDPAVSATVVQASPDSSASGQGAHAGADHLAHAVGAPEVRRFVRPARRWYNRRVEI